MVCPRCTLLHPEYAVTCRQCGYALRSTWERISTRALTMAPTAVGAVSGVSLLSCISVTLIVPAIAAQALSIGAYFGIISITNIWLSVYRDGEGEWLRGGFRSRDGNNESITLARHVDWHGWKTLRGELPPQAGWPIVWTRFYVVERNRAALERGGIWLRDFTAFYPGPPDAGCNAEAGLLTPRADVDVEDLIKTDPFVLRRF